VANQHLAAALKSLEATGENVAIARSAFLPNVVGGATFNVSGEVTFSEQNGVIPTRVGFVGLAVEQLIFDETAFSNYTVQKDLYASQDARVRNTKFDIVTQAAQAYLGVLVAQDLLEIQRQNAALTEQNLETARQQLQAGVVTRSDTLRWENQRYANEQEIIEQQASLYVSRIALNQIRNRPSEEPFTLEETSIADHGFIFSSDVVAASLDNAAKARIIRDYLVDLGLARSPALLALDLEIAAQSRAKDAQHKWLVPSATFATGATTRVYQAGEGVDDSAESTFWKLAATLTWNVFDGGASIAETRQIDGEYAGLLFQRQELKTSIDKGIRTAFAYVTADYQKIDLARAQLATAEENYELINQAYLAGTTSIQDLLDAQMQIVAGNGAVIAAHYAFLLDLLALEQAMGYFPVLEEPLDVANRIRVLEERLLTSGTS
jgi:outer membrane protein